MSEYKEISPLRFDFRGNPHLEASLSPKKRSVRRGTLFLPSEGMGAEKDLPEAERAWILDRRSRRAT